jgi:hypothetical protein
MSWTTISAVLHTGTRCLGRPLASPISSAAHHRDFLAGATAKVPPDPTSGQDPNRHHMITASEPSPRKPFPLFGRSSARHASARSDAAFTTQQPRRSSPTHRLGDHKKASPSTRIIILTAQPPSLMTSAVARPRQRCYEADEGRHIFLHSPSSIINDKESRKWIMQSLVRQPRLSFTVHWS